MNIPSVAVFPGVFDPPHFGHYSLVEAAVREFRIDMVLVCPIPSPNHKPNASSYSHRLSMVEIMAQHHDSIVTPSRGNGLIGLLPASSEFRLGVREFTGADSVFRLVGHDIVERDLGIIYRFCELGDIFLVGTTSLQFQLPEAVSRLRCVKTLKVAFSTSSTKF